MKMWFAIAFDNLYGTEYLIKENCDDYDCFSDYCYSDNIGRAILFHTPEETADLLFDGDYIVEVEEDDDGALSVIKNSTIKS